MFPEPVEAFIDLPRRLFHVFRRRVSNLFFDIAVAAILGIRFRG
jgi:hypothetical protein